MESIAQIVGVEVAKKEWALVGRGTVLTVSDTVAAEEGNVEEEPEAEGTAISVARLMGAGDKLGMCEAPAPLPCLILMLTLFLTPNLTLF